MHISSPTCSLFGEVGITQGMLECHLNLALFNRYGVPVYLATPFVDIQVDCPAPPLWTNVGNPWSFFIFPKFPKSQIFGPFYPRFGAKTITKSR